MHALRGMVWCFCGWIANTSICCCSCCFCCCLLLLIILHACRRSQTKKKKNGIKRIGILNIIYICSTAMLNMCVCMWLCMRFIMSIIIMLLFNLCVVVYPYDGHDISDVWSQTHTHTNSLGRLFAWTHSTVYVCYKNCIRVWVCADVCAAVGNNLWVIA